MTNDGDNTRLLSRRSWTALALAVPVAAQITSPVQSTAPTAAVDDIRKVSQQLATTEVPMSVEPAFVFRA